MIHNHLALVQCGCFRPHFHNKFCGCNAQRNCGRLIRFVFDEGLYEDPRVVLVSFAQQKLTSTDKEDPYDVTGTVEIQDVTGTLQVYYRSTNVFGNKTNFDSLPPISLLCVKKRQILLRNIV